MSADRHAMPRNPHLRGVSFEDVATRWRLAVAVADLMRATGPAPLRLAQNPDALRAYIGGGIDPEDICTHRGALCVRAGRWPLFPLSAVPRHLRGTLSRAY